MNKVKLLSKISLSKKPLRHRVKSILPLVLAYLLAWNIPAIAQQELRHIEIDKGIPFVRILEQLESKFNTSFSYNHSLMKGLRVPNFRPPATLDLNIAFLAKHLPVRFEPNGEDGYLLIPIRSPVGFRIVDAESNDPIELIHLKYNDKPWEHAFAKDSLFSFNNVFATDSLLIRSSFYATQKLRVGQLLKRSSSKTVTIYLQPESQVLNEVRIEAYLTRGIDAKFGDHSLHVNIRELSLMAGETDGDVFGVIKTIPGIGTPDGKPGSLNIRGSTFDQSMLFFDGIPIFHTGHFFGTISPYNPSSLGTIEIQRGTSSAQWGGRVGGLINIKTEEGLPDSAEFGVQVNSLYAGVHFKTPMANNKLGLSLAMRSNLPRILDAPKPERFSELNFQGSKIDFANTGENAILDAFNVTFSDINAKLTYQPNESQHFSFNYINITNRFLYHLFSLSRNLHETQTSALNNQGASLLWNAAISKKVSTELTVSQSMISIEETNEEILGINDRKDDLANNQLNDFRLRSKIKYQLGKAIDLSGGYQITQQQTAIHEERDGIAKNQPPGGDATIHGGFLASSLNFAQKLSLNLGLRLDHYSPLETSYLDPRISLSYRLSKHVFLKSSAGRSHQFISQRVKRDFDDFRVANQFWLLADRKNPVLEGVQAMAGAMFEKRGWIIDLELYAKTTNGISRETIEKNLIYGSMQTQGADLFIKKKWNKFTSWASYTFSQTETEFDVKTTVYFNQGHVLNLVGLLELGRWNFTSSWAYLSGMPINLPTLDPNHSNSNGQTELTVPYDTQFPAQHQLDLSATYKFWEKQNGWKGVLGLSMINVYNQQNIINVFQNNPRVDDPYRYAVGMAPNVHLSLLF